MKCEKCSKTIDGSYGSGRFCSKSCANSRERPSHVVEKIRKGCQKWSKENKETMRQKMIQVNNCPERLAKAKETWRRKRNPNDYRKWWVVEEVGECEVCHIKKWNGKPITFEVHHLNGNNKDNRKENLQCLCPNCHSQTEGWRGKYYE